MTVCIAFCADVDQLAHYVMLRFGEELNAKEVSSEEHPGASESAPQQQNQQQWVQQHDSDFSIAALKVPSLGTMVNGSSSTGVLRSPVRNGQQLASKIRSETEQSSLQSTLASLLALHQGLRETQQQVLSLQQQLMQQQAGVLQAMQPDGGQQQMDPAARAGHGAGHDGGHTGGELVRRNVGLRGGDELPGG
jgi:hypothetical protein